MQQFLLYSVKVAAVLAVFYMFYRLLLSRETLHRLNRIVLLSIAVLSFVLPAGLLTVTRKAPVEAVMQAPSADVPVATLIQAPEAGVPGAGILAENLPAAGITAGGMGPEDLQSESPAPASASSGTASGITAEQGSSPVSWHRILLTAAMVLYLLGAASVLVKLLLSLHSLRLTIRRSRKIPQDDGTTIVVTDSGVTPSSWMRYIFLSPADAGSPEPAIIRHERAHIALGHSWDLLLVDIVKAVQWFNPAIWMLRRDLASIHEYEADKAVLDAGADARAYQLLLVRKAMTESGYTIANGFSFSTLRGRIRMMQHRPSGTRDAWKLLAFLPLAGVTLVLTAHTRTIYESPEPVSSAAAGDVVVVSYRSDGSCTVAGMVTAADTKEPLEGATVLQQGTPNAVFTDAQGRFELAATEGDQPIVISSLGYATRTLDVNARHGTQLFYVNLVLQPESQVLNEAVVLNDTYKPRAKFGSINDFQEFWDKGGILRSDTLNIARLVSEGAVFAISDGSKYVRKRSTGERLFVSEPVPVEEFSRLLSMKRHPVLVSDEGNGVRRYTLFKDKLPTAVVER